MKYLNKIIAYCTSFIVKNILTESVIKEVTGMLGDKLVKSSKNKLDDALWSKVKKNLDI
tara:strand:- start:1005 stop:1181 length:177 start_codon:yes stop_codon:yes gene_type:complete